jgi:hypothetical protein
MPPPAATQAAARLWTARVPSVEITGTALSVAGKNKRLSWVHEPPAGSLRFTRGRVRELKNGHYSVTVQNRTHVYMNFFHHKDLGNHLLQLCSKVVKHPVYIYIYIYIDKSGTLLPLSVTFIIYHLYHSTSCRLRYWKHTQSKQE